MKKLRISWNTSAAKTDIKLRALIGEAIRHEARMAGREIGHIQFMTAFDVAVAGGFFEMTDRLAAQRISKEMQAALSRRYKDGVIVCDEYEEILDRMEGIG
jgi:hypothetical protein